MSGLRTATGAEAARLWPAVRASRLFSTQQEFSLFRDRDPWRVQVTESGESLVLAPWRAHADLLAIRGLWAAGTRVGALVDHAISIAREQGFRRVLSPLARESAFDAYREAGMDVLERIVALQGFAEEIAVQATGDGISIRRATPDDMVDLERLDGACFDEFWRYGVTELTDSFQRERMTVASAEGEVLGYATCSIHGASGTVGRLAVSPSARRGGLGRALLVDAAAWAAGSNAYALTLCTQRDNRASRKLYASCGLFELPDGYVIGVCGT